MLIQMTKWAIRQDTGPGPLDTTWLGNTSD
jgi:hypothetical protein